MGKQYCMINTMCSAISMTHKVNSVQVGQHPMVSHFLKGIFNNRPPTPRHSSTWDVDIVLNCIMNLPDKNKLSLQCVSHKLAMLMALSNASSLAIPLIYAPTDFSKYVKFLQPNYILQVLLLLNFTKIKYPLKIVTLR